MKYAVAKLVLHEMKYLIFDPTKPFSIKVVFIEQVDHEEKSLDPFIRSTEYYLGI